MTLIMDEFIIKVNDNAISVRFLAIILRRISGNMEEICQNTNNYWLKVSWFNVRNTVANINMSVSEVAKQLAGAISFFNTIRGGETEF